MKVALNVITISPNTQNSIGSAVYCVKENTVSILGFNIHLFNFLLSTYICVCHDAAVICFALHRPLFYRFIQTYGVELSYKHFHVWRNFNLAAIKPVKFWKDWSCEVQCIAITWHPWSSSFVNIYVLSFFSDTIGPIGTILGTMYE